MDFIPEGTITIRMAVDLILRKRHGPDWGSQPINMEDEPDPESGGYHYDREAIALVRNQISEARDELHAALVSGALKAKIEEGPPVPVEYWSTNRAQTALSSNLLALGETAEPEDLRWHNRRILFDEARFQEWLSGGSDRPKRARTADPEADAILRVNIETVLATAVRLWKPHIRPGRNEMARQLAADPQVKSTGYSAQTIRKILDGSYSSSKRLEIPGLAGFDTRG